MRAGYASCGDGWEWPNSAKNSVARMRGYFTVEVDRFLMINNTTVPINYHSLCWAQSLNHQVFSSDRCSREEYCNVNTKQASLRKNHGIVESLTINQNRNSLIRFRLSHQAINSNYLTKSTSHEKGSSPPYNGKIYRILCIQSHCAVHWRCLHNNFSHR
jgi:hypothetical protein